MELEKNPKTRPILRKLLELEDRLIGVAFPKMKRTKQISTFACGPATLEMLLSLVGIKTSQTRIIRSIRAGGKIRKFGIDVGDMAKAANIAAKKKAIFWSKHKAKISDLDLAVNKYGYPVGVEWQGVFYEQADEDSGHYGVVTKIDKSSGYLRIADPYFNGFFGYKGTDRKFKISSFFKKWWDVNEVKIAGRSKTKTVKDTRVMFVVTPGKVTWPKKLGMVKVSR